MFKRFRWLATGAAIAVATLSPVAHATVIDFNDPLLAGLYFGGDPVSQFGYQLTPNFDFGSVTRSVDILGGVAPTGNTTQFYFNSNDGDVLLTRASGSAFSLDGFSAAFVPQANPAAGPQNFGLVAIATTMTGASFGTIFGLGITTGTVGVPFISFGGAADFARFTNLASVDFFTCANFDGSSCAADRNNGQFALDNILVTSIAAPVPEPEITALMALGLFAMAAVSRRRRAR